MTPNFGPEQFAALAEKLKDVPADHHHALVLALDRDGVQFGLRFDREAGRFTWSAEGTVTHCWTGTCRGTTGAGELLLSWP